MPGSDRPARLAARLAAVDRGVKISPICATMTLQLADSQLPGIRSDRGVDLVDLPDLVADDRIEGGHRVGGGCPAFEVPQVRGVVGHRPPALAQDLAHPAEPALH